MALDKAKWTVAVGKRSTDPDGTLQVEGVISDAGKPQADFSISITENREVSVVFTNRPGSKGLQWTNAWVKEST
jgi:hypothetical protein